MTENVLIEASAGTGKTQALAERLIKLVRGGLEPHEIVALTFSRAAAGEIFERFVSLLAERAGDDPVCAELLRKVIATQHLSQIGTLDSFLMRIVRAFPLELGLVGDLAMMDEYEAASERAAVSFSILRRTDAALKRTFADAFSLAMNRADLRSFTESYRVLVKSWHERVVAMPSESAWGDPTAIWGRDPAFAHVTERELAFAADALEGLFDGDAWGDFVAWVRGFRGSFGSPKGIAKKLLTDVDVFAGDAVEFTFSRRKYSLTREQTLRLRDALMCVFGYVVRMKLELAHGVYRLISAFEAAYDAKVRRTGRLVFSDVPRLIASLPPERRMALEYRMDAKIGAWALDEFQDTSREQWKVLKDLLDEAKQSQDGKSVFIVGDRKQAIYGWRNGDVRIFSGERDGGMYEIGELNKTWRSGPAIVEAVNRVFARGRIKSEFPAWECPEHETARPGLSGFVRVEESPGRTMEDFLEPVYVALRAAIGEKASDPRRRGITAAVLVRTNKFGEMLADGLRSLGFEGAVWEGESAILDTPALSGFLDLLQLADHPGDALTYRHFRLTPLAAAKYPDGVPPAAEISREMSLSFTTRGIVRTLRALRAGKPRCRVEPLHRGALHRHAARGGGVRARHGVRHASCGLRVVPAVQEEAHRRRGGQGEDHDDPPLQGSWVRLCRAASLRVGLACRRAGRPPCRRRLDTARPGRARFKGCWRPRGGVYAAQGPRRAGGALHLLRRDDAGKTGHDHCTASAGNLAEVLGHRPERGTVRPFQS